MLVSDGISKPLNRLSLFTVSSTNLFCWLPGGQLACQCVDICLRRVVEWQLADASTCHLHLADGRMVDLLFSPPLG